MFLVRTSITRATSRRGVGPGNLDFFGPQKWIDAISLDPKKSLFPGANPLPLVPTSITCENCYYIFLPALFKRKLNLNFLLASLILKLFQKPHQISVPAFLHSQWSIFSSVHSWHWNNFQDHRQLSEQFLESQAAMETSCMKRVSK